MQKTDIMETKDGIQIKEILKGRGMKATPQRIAVYEAMKKLGHASADMVGEVLRESYPSLTIATIYNVLEMFVESGLLKKRFSSNNKMYFDVNTFDHIHIYCSDSNSYQDYINQEFTDMVNSYFKNREIDGFNITDVDIQLVGTKVNC